MDTRSIQWFRFNNKLKISKPFKVEIDIKGVIDGMVKNELFKVHLLHMVIIEGSGFN